MQPGDRVIWAREARGGYGYVERIPAEVVAVTPSRIRIRAQRKSGETVERTVRPESLRAAKPVSVP
jgi:hypothetical protein